MAISPISRSSASDPSKEVGNEEPKTPNVRELARTMHIPLGRPAPIQRNIIQQESPKEQGEPVGNSGINLPSIPAKTSRGRMPLPSEKVDLPSLPDKDKKIQEPPPRKAVRGLPKPPVLSEGKLAHDKPWQESGLFEQLPRELFPLIDKELNKFAVYNLPTNSKKEIETCINQMKIFWKAPPGAPADQIIFGEIDVTKFARWIGENKISIQALQDCSLTSEDLKTLLPYLEYVEVNRMNFNLFSGLLEISNNIKHLKIFFAEELTDENFKHLTAKLPELKSLDLCCHSLTDATLLSIAKLQGLTSLRFDSAYNFTDAGFKHINSLINLESLVLGYCDKMTDISFANIPNLKNLTSLTLTQYPQLTDRSLEHIAKLTNLKSFYAHKCPKLTGTGFRHFANLKNFTSLSLPHCYKLTDFTHLANLTTLKSLDLTACTESTDTCLEFIGNLINLESLNLNFCSLLTDTGLMHLVNLKKLKSLDFKRCEELTDICLELIANLINLESLNLSFCFLLTDTGLMRLANLKNLKSLELVHPFYLKERDVVDLQIELPGLVIIKSKE